MTFVRIGGVRIRVDSIAAYEARKGTRIVHVWVDGAFDTDGGSAFCFKDDEHGTIVQNLDALLAPSTITEVDE